MVIAGAFGTVAAFCFSFHTPQALPGAECARSADRGVVLRAVVSPARLIAWPVDWPVPYAPGKEAPVAEIKNRERQARGELGGQSPEFVKLHSATAEVEVGPSIMSPPMIGGDMGLEDEMQIAARAVGQDGAAPTMLYEGASDLTKFPFLDDTQAASAYVAHQASGRSDQQTMVIGVGGGVDVLVALANGAKRVTAVELNTAMIDMATERYDDYLGGLFTTGQLADRIDLVNSEGRAYLRSHDDKYDVIQMSGVDSYTALSSGAYTLSESYLYTVEAVRDFYEHLNPDGIVCYSRFIQLPPRAARETMRLANICREGLAAAGVEEPQKHIVVLQGHEWASTMFKQSPFTQAEVDALREFARRQLFVGLIFDPFRASDSEFVPEPSHFSLMRTMIEQVITGGSATIADRDDAMRAWCTAAAEVAKGSAPSAEVVPEPFRGTEMGGRITQLVTALAPQIRTQAAYLRQTTADFLELLAGDDAQRAAFYERYEFDVSPSTDDAPFFFNYYRWSSLLSGRSKASSDGEIFNYHTNWPVGHTVLLGSMVQILLLAAALIFLPLRKLARGGLRTPGSLRVFAYFAALGLGFMLVEIALMQKLVIFLGHPTYALSVVLTSLLASAGVGSLLAGRIEHIGRRHLLWIVAAIVAVILVDVLAVNYLLPQLLGMPLVVRMIVVVVLLVPTGLVLGVPFPTGIRLAEQQFPHLIPWGWAINAFFSVFGSIFCIVLSMAIGFSNVFYVAIGVYVLGITFMKVPRREREPKPVAESPPAAVVGDPLAVLSEPEPEA